MYLSEMAPPKLRGALNFMFQLATTSGILIAQLVNYGALCAPRDLSCMMVAANLCPCKNMTGS